MERQPRLHFRRQGLGPPRFGLRSLMLVVSGFALVLAVQIWAGPLAAATVAFFLLTIAAHMASTWLGHQLRHEAALRLDQEALSKTEESVPEGETFVAQAVSEADQQYFRQHTGLGWQIVLSTLIGALLGALVGLLLMVRSLPPRASWAAWICGLAAFVTLGALGGFALSSFAVSLYRSWKDAS